MRVIYGKYYFVPLEIRKKKVSKSSTNRHFILIKNYSLSSFELLNGRLMIISSFQEISREYTPIKSCMNGFLDVISHTKKKKNVLVNQKKNLFIICKVSFTEK